ncbi:MAG: S1-like domain-containing RNA-binding protein, partial [Peptostreptococcus anaerobius]
MINFGNYNNLKVMREKEYGFFLDGQTGNSSDDILLPSKNI